MTRAIARSLTKLWNADEDLTQATRDHARIRDLLAIERLLRHELPAGAVTLGDLRDAALARTSYAKAVLGNVEIDLRSDVAPLWRPLLVALGREVRVTWRTPAVPMTWFTGEVIEAPTASSAAEPIRVSCANPRSEAIEALRWMRELLASDVPVNAIAICAATTETWDEHFEALAAEAALPLHFSHGRLALGTYNGQACAALADVLVQGLNQRRVRRLFRYARDNTCFKDLPSSWARGLKRDAALLTVRHWQHALDEAVGDRDDGFDPRPLVMPVIKLLARGPEAAKDAGCMVLGRAEGALWDEALRRAPGRALLLSLQELRLPDRRDPGASVVWCPGRHLAEAPRAYVRLLGLSARSWPRRGGEDPLLPSHIISAGRLDPAWVTQEDREHFRMIREGAAKECVISRSRRDAQGKTLPPSSLATQFAVPETLLKRTRMPRHAFGEGDRLLARPQEAAGFPQIMSAMQCWRNRQGSALTAHDGLLCAEHPVVMRALEQVQSATSLRVLLRDPLGFVWRYGLRWLAPPFDDQPLSLDPRVYGELVHDLLKYAIRELEPVPGVRTAEPHQIEAAIEKARRFVRDSWPLEKPVPPEMLWDHTLNLAVELAKGALTFDPRITTGSESWAEALFGQKETSSEANPPWATDIPVPIPGTILKMRGKIDRLDIRIDDKRRAAQVTDYKTGKPPERAIILDGGREVQRISYLLAVRHLRPDIDVLRARLKRARALGGRILPLYAC